VETLTPSAIAIIPSYAAPSHQSYPTNEWSLSAPQAPVPLSFAAIDAQAFVCSTKSLDVHQLAAIDNTVWAASGVYQ
jgi:hypothetical protein